MEIRQQTRRHRLHDHRHGRLHRSPFLQRSTRQPTRRPHRHHPGRPVAHRIHRLQLGHQAESIRILNGEVLFRSEGTLFTYVFALSSSRKTLFTSEQALFSSEETLSSLKTIAYQ